MSFYVLEWIDTRRQDEKHRDGWTRFVKGGCKIQWPPHNILGAQSFFNKIAEEVRRGFYYCVTTSTNFDVQSWFTNDQKLIHIWQTFIY